jgi:hypothetical protein
MNILEIEILDGHESNKICGGAGVLPLVPLLLSNLGTPAPPIVPGTSFASAGEAGGEAAGSFNSTMLGD